MLFQMITFVCIMMLQYANAGRGCQYVKLVYKDNKCSVFSEKGTLNLNLMFPHKPGRCLPVTGKKFSFIEHCK